MSGAIQRLTKACSNQALLKNWLVSRLQSFIGSKEYVSAGYVRSDSDDGLYIRAVEEANRSFQAFARFKRNASYRRILEHLSYEQGLGYLDVLRSEAPDLVEKMNVFLVNDVVGGPVRYHYDGIGLASPTTFRYVKVAADLRNLFGDLNGLKVAEIGGGYGGQLLVLDRMCRFQRYDLYDLLPVLQLTAKYLEAHLLNSSYATSTLNQCGSDAMYDLVISNYAFSELPAELATKYIEKVLSKASRGYLTMNSGRGETERNRGKLTLKEYGVLLPAFEILEENPLTGRDNYILAWGHKEGGLPVCKSLA